MARSADWMVVALLAFGLSVASCGARQGGPAAGTPKGPAPGMNAQGVVIDAEKIEAGSGATVQGINDWEGEITGKPFPGAKFAKLKIGMSRAQVDDLIGKPTDEGAYISGKAFIPFYFGSDRVRFQLAYKGQGRLIFASDAGFGTTAGGHLTWIIYCPTESGYL